MTHPYREELAGRIEKLTRSLARYMAPSAVEDMKKAAAALRQSPTVEEVAVPIAVLNEAAGVLDCEGYGPLSLSLLSCLAAPAVPDTSGAATAGQDGKEGE